MSAVKDWFAKIATGIAVNKITKMFQGKKRWLSVIAYLVLIAGTVMGVPVDQFLASVVDDPGFDRQDTVAALVAAAAVQFRFFQNMGANRELRSRVEGLEKPKKGKG